MFHVRYFSILCSVVLATVLLYGATVVAQSLPQPLSMDSLSDNRQQMPDEQVYRFEGVVQFFGSYLPDLLGSRFPVDPDLARMIQNHRAGMVPNYGFGGAQIVVTRQTIPVSPEAENYADDETSCHSDAAAVDGAAVYTPNASDSQSRSSRGIIWNPEDRPRVSVLVELHGEDRAELIRIDKSGHMLTLRESGCKIRYDVLFGLLKDIEESAGRNVCCMKPSVGVQLAPNEYMTLDQLDLCLASIMGSRHSQGSKFFISVDKIDGLYVYFIGMTAKMDAVWGVEIFNGPDGREIVDGRLVDLANLNTEFRGRYMLMQQSGGFFDLLKRQIQLKPIALESNPVVFQ